MKTKHIKAINIVFIICFLSIILIPVFTMNFTKDQISEIDNKKLVEFPTNIGKGFRKGFESYISERIGFRGEMIQAYQRINDIAFNKLVHPTYMYGKDGYVFFKSNDYLADYQHLNLDKEYIKKCADYILSISDYLDKQGILFLYILAPDKKTVYSEYFPSSININGDTSRTDLWLDALNKRSIRYIYPIEQFLRAKEQEQIYNVKFDAGHWNENGAFIGHSLITKELKKDFPIINLLNKNDYNISMVKKNTLPVSYFEIDEEIPVYKLKRSKSIVNKKYNDSLKYNNSYSMHFNESIPNNPKLLVFHDSYFNGHQKFYTENFSEVVFLHSNNLENIKYYLGIFKPDIVLLENVERLIQAKGYLFDKSKMEKADLN